jgi:hypothetical protein
MADPAQPVARADDVREAFQAAQDHADASAYEAAKLGSAAAIRMTATMLRSQAEFLTMQARTFEGIADDFEKGRVPLPKAAPELRMVMHDEPIDADREDVPAGYVEAGGDGQEGLSETMRGFLDLFDDRLRRSPYFWPAVNEAAAAERRADEDTARLVADRIRELAEGGKADG